MLTFQTDFPPNKQIGHTNCYVCQVTCQQPIRFKDYLLITGKAAQAVVKMDWEVMECCQKRQENQVLASKKKTQTFLLHYARWQLNIS